MFNPSVGGGDSSAFTGSLNKHLAMFNIAGDQNGRHDLPGAPMLDDVTAALFFLGLGLCVVRAGRWQYIFPPLWFVAALAGGVLSLPFEAPQSHRTLENSIVTALCAGIVLGEFWQALTRAPIAAPQDPAPAPAARPARAGWRGLRRRPAPATTSLPVRVRGARPVVAAGAPPPRRWRIGRRTP